MKFEVIKQEAPYARWVNWRVELHVLQFKLVQSHWLAMQRWHSYAPWS